MNRTPFAIAFLLTLCTAATGAAQEPAEAAAVARMWWHAFAVGDTMHLRQTTAPELSVVLSAGRSFTHDEAMAQARSHVTNGSVTMDWSEESARTLAPGVVLVTARQKETIGRGQRTFRFSTLLQRTNGAWKVTYGQTTREVALSPRAAGNASGDYSEFAGAYRGPAGGIMRVSVQGSALLLTDPSGAETTIEPIGPGMFESSRITLMGTLRFGFVRDASGRVISLLRIADDVVTFPRVVE